MVQNGQDGSEWPRIVENGPGCSEWFVDGSEWPRMVQDGWGRLRMAQDG